MPSYNTFNDSFTGNDQITTVEFKGDQMTARGPSQVNSGAANASGLINVGGVQMPADQAERYGLLPDGFVQRGESSEQALNRHEVAATARRMAADNMPPQAQQPQQPVNPRQNIAQAVGQSLGIGDYTPPQQQEVTQAPRASGESFAEGAPAPAQLSEETAQFLDTAEQTFGQADVLTVLNDVVKNGEVDPHALTEIASTHGMDPEQLAANISGVVGGLSDAYHNYASTYGFDSEQIIEWAQENMPDAYQRGMKDVFYTRDPRAMDDVIAAYAENLDKIDPAAILNGQLAEGMTATYDSGRGVVVLSHPSFGQVPWQQAVRLGLVDVGPRRA